MEYVIFGAGNYGEVVYKNLRNDYDIKYFCDNSKEKQGTLLCNLEIISPQEINGKEVIIASQFYLEIAFQLIHIGIKNFFIAFGYENKKIKLTNLDFNQFENFKVDFNKICTVSLNNSGSNTLAVKKLANSNLFNVVNVNTSKKDASYYYHIFTSGIILETEISYKKLKIDGQIYIQLWHGFPLKNMGYMDKSVDLCDKKKWEQHFNECTAIFSYSNIYNALMGVAYSTPGNKFYVTGMPRNDFLFKANGRSNLKKILKKDINNKKLIFYAPTFRLRNNIIKNGADNAYLYTMTDIDLFEFDKFLEQNNSILIMKLHPIDIENITKKLPLLVLKNIVLLKDEDLYSYGYDLYELLNAFDLLITDYSSIYFDYLLLDRPIIFMPIDLAEYSETRGMMLDPYDLWTPGEKAVNYESLKNALVCFFCEHDVYADERNRLKRIIHKYTDGNSTDRVLTKIAELIFNKS